MPWSCKLANRQKPKCYYLYLFPEERYPRVPSNGKTKNQIDHVTIRKKKHDLLKNVILSRIVKFMLAISHKTLAVLNNIIETENFRSEIIFVSLFVCVYACTMFLLFRRP